jgi:signal transduction histidine kinase
MTFINDIRRLNVLIQAQFRNAIARVGGRAIATLTVSLLLTIGSIAYNDNWILTMEKQDKVIAKVGDTIAQLSALRADLYAAESAQRGYLLMHRPEYLDSFNAAVTGARATIKNIRALSEQSADGAVSTEEDSWMEKLPETLEAKSTEMQLTMALAMKGNVQMAKQVVILGKGTEETDRFVLQTQALIEKQNQRLVSLEKTRINTLIKARVSLISVAFVLIVLVVVVIKQLLGELAAKNVLQLQLSQEITASQQTLKQQSQLLNSLALKYQSYVESERQKLSRELHDELGSILTATKMDVSWVIKKVKDSAPDIAAKLKKTNNYLDQGINFKRQIVESLHPSIMTTLGLWPALKVLVEDAAERNQWQLVLNLPTDTTKLSDTIGLIAYRVVQETLNNANKYANASKIAVDILIDENHLKLEIEDNGKGFDVSTLDGNTHGLAGMRHRLLAIGGKFEISSVIDQGTITRVIIPLNMS